MAVLDHHDHSGASPSQNACAVQFCLTWIGFFVLIGLFSWIVAAI